MLVPLLLLSTSLITSAMALPVDSYGHYHDYGRYDGPYGDYPGFPPSENEKVGDSGAVGVDQNQSCGYGGDKGCIERVKSRQVSVSIFC